MGRHRWGRAAAGIVLAAAVISTVSGCGGHADVDKGEPKKPAATAPSFSKASAAFQDKVANSYLDDECTTEAGTCWDRMKDIVASARVLRKAMNGEKSVGADFWTDAYALINKMEKGLKPGRDLGVNEMTSNRPAVFGSAHDLADWLDEHPIK
uniref:Lipoprotein n=1 Tax=Streptomyces sp. NBC_01393 TaxID=2903851 RepID=A0AAU3HQ57_9ACTN